MSALADSFLEHYNRVKNGKTTYKINPYTGKYIRTTEPHAVAATMKHCLSEYRFRR